MDLCQNDCSFTNYSAKLAKGHWITQAFFLINFTVVFKVGIFEVGNSIFDCDFSGCQNDVEIIAIRETKVKADEWRILNLDLLFWPLTLWPTTKADTSLLFFLHADAVQFLLITFGRLWKSRMVAVGEKLGPELCKVSWGGSSVPVPGTLKYMPTQTLVVAK